MDGGEEEQGKARFQKEEKNKEGKGTKKELCKVKNSSFFLVVLHPCGQGRKLPF